MTSMARQGPHDLISVEAFNREVGRYPTRDILLGINRIAALVDNAPNGLLQQQLSVRQGRFPTTKTLTVAAFHLAFLVKIAILESNDHRAGTVSQSELLRIANNVSHIEDISTRSAIESQHDLNSILIRFAYEQFPLQRLGGFLLARALYLYGEASELANPRGISIDPLAEFEKLVGMSVKQFVQVGACIYSLALDHPTIQVSNLTETSEETLKPILAHTPVTKVLNSLSLDYSGFRGEALKHRAAEPYLEKYEFNPLWEYPIVRLHDGSFCVPVPKILFHRITRGIDFYLRKALRGPEGANPFATAFGTVFEEYVGLQLKRTFGEELVHPEPRYGRPEQRGPDWIVVLGDECLVLECRSGLIRQETKQAADIELVLADLRKLVTDAVSKLPSKIEDLRGGKAGVEVSEVRTFHPMVVIYDELIPYGAWHSYINAAVKNDLPADFKYYVLSIEDFESLCGLLEYMSLSELLTEWTKRATEFYDDLGLFLDEQTKKVGAKRRNPMLADRFDEFFGEIVPGFSERISGKK